MPARRWRDLVAKALTTISTEERRVAIVYVDGRRVPANTPVDVGGIAVRRGHPTIVFFLDLEPGVNWGHRCRYVLMDPDGERLESIEARQPPFLPTTPSTLRLAWHGAGAPAWALATTTGVDLDATPG